MHYSIRNELSELDDLGMRLESMAGFGALGEDQRYTLHLALEEMISNIIKYGYDDELAHEISIDFDFTSQGVKVRISDDGHPFNPLCDARKTEVAENLDDQEIGGLGVYLVKQMTTDLQYRRDGEQNILEFSILGEEEKR